MMFYFIAIYSQTPWYLHLYNTAYVLWTPSCMQHEDRNMT